MSLAVPPEMLRQALAQLAAGSIIQAVYALTREGGVGIAEAKAWCDGLAASTEPLEAALGANYLQAKAVRDAAPLASLELVEAWYKQAHAAVAAGEPVAAIDAVALPPPPPLPLIEDEALLVRALNYDFPPGALDLAYRLLYTPVGVPEMALARAAHLCRLANSFCLMYRKGEIDQAGALGILRGGAKGYSEETYEHAWQNGMEVTGRGA